MIRSDCLQSKLKRLFCESIRAFTMRTTLSKALKDMCDIEEDLRRRRKENSGCRDSPNDMNSALKLEMLRRNR